MSNSGYVHVILTNLNFYFSASLLLILLFWYIGSWSQLSYNHRCVLCCLLHTYLVLYLALFEVHAGSKFCCINIYFCIRLHTFVFTCLFLLLFIFVFIYLFINMYLHSYLYLLSVWGQLIFFFPVFIFMPDLACFQKIWVRDFYCPKMSL